MRAAIEHISSPVVFKSVIHPVSLRKCSLCQARLCILWSYLSARPTLAVSVPSLSPFPWPLTKRQPATYNLNPAFPTTTAPHFPFQRISEVAVALHGVLPLAPSKDFGALAESRQVPASIQRCVARRNRLLKTKNISNMCPGAMGPHCLHWTNPGKLELLVFCCSYYL